MKTNKLKQKLWIDVYTKKINKESIEKSIKIADYSVREFTKRFETSVISKKSEPNNRDLIKNNYTKCDSEFLDRIKLGIKNMDF
jgi:hypothetical protein